MGKIEKILFVDDDNVCSFLNVSLVEEMQIAKQVTAVPSALEAIEYIKIHYPINQAYAACAPDLIFLDIKMPGMDGFELIRELEKDKNIDKSRFLIVVLTTILNQVDEEKIICNNDMVFACLIKPLKEENLKSLLHEMHVL